MHQPTWASKADRLCLLLDHEKITPANIISFHDNHTWLTWMDLAQWAALHNQVSLLTVIFEQQDHFVDIHRYRVFYYAAIHGHVALSMQIWHDTMFRHATEFTASLIMTCIHRGHWLFLQTWLTQVGSRLRADVQYVLDAGMVQDMPWFMVWFLWSHTRPWKLRWSVTDLYFIHGLMLEEHLIQVLVPLIQVYENRNIKA